MAAGVRLLDYCATGNVAVEGWLHEEALLLTLAAILAVFRFGLGTLPTLALCAGAGLVLRQAGLA